MGQLNFSVTAIFNFIQILLLFLDLNFAKFQLQFGTIFPKRPQHFKGIMRLAMPKNILFIFQSVVLLRRSTLYQSHWCAKQSVYVYRFESLKIMISEPGDCIK